MKIFEWFKIFLEILGDGNGREKATIVLLSIISGLAGALSLYIIGNAMAHIGETDFFYLVRLILALIIFIVAKRISLRMARSFAENRVAYIRSTISERLRFSEFPFIERLDQGDACVKMTLDAKTISKTCEIIIHTYQTAFIIFFTILYLGWISPVALLILGVLVFIGTVLFRINNKVIKKTIHDYTKKEEEIFDSMSHLFYGFKELKLNNEKNIDFFKSNLRPLAKRIRQLRIRAGYDFSNNDCLFDALYLGFIGLFLLVNASAQVAVIVVIIFFFLDEQLQAITTSIPYLIKTIVSIERLDDFKMRTIQDRSGFEDEIGKYFKDRIRSFQKIVIDNLQFNYTGKDGQATYSLGAINLTLFQGEVLFIVGGNGSGKSTFLKLLAGLYPPFSGSFKIDSARVRMCDHRYLFSAVFSDYYLFDSLYGIDNIDDQKITALLQSMDLAHKTKWDGNQFTTIDLSTGQKKRLALVVALLEDKSIYIFDEWAAEQDLEFRVYFYENVLSELKANGKTVIVVSHDDRYFHHADHIVKMEYGKTVSYA